MRERICRRHSGREKSQALLIQAQNFRHAQLGVDAHAIEGTVRDVHFDGQVGRRIGAEVDLRFAAHVCFVGDPVAIVGFEALLVALRRSVVERPKWSGRFSSCVSVTTSKPKKAARYWCMGQRHDFQEASIIGDAQMPVGKLTQEPGIAFPGHTLKHKHVRRHTDRRHDCKPPSANIPPGSHCDQRPRTCPVPRVSKLVAGLVDFTGSGKIPIQNALTDVCRLALHGSIKPAGLHLQQEP